MNHRASTRCMVVAFLLTLFFGASSGVAQDGTSEVLLDTSFETVFPRLPWRVSRAADAAEVDWGRTDYRATGGRYSIYCSGMGPAAPGDGGPAPANTASWAIVGPYDLSQTTAGSLTFNLTLLPRQRTVQVIVLRVQVQADTPVRAGTFHRVRFR